MLAALWAELGNPALYGWSKGPEPCRDAKRLSTRHQNGVVGQCNGGLIAWTEEDRRAAISAPLQGLQGSRSAGGLMLLQGLSRRVSRCSRAASQVWRLMRPRCAMLLHQNFQISFCCVGNAALLCPLKSQAALPQA